MITLYQQFFKATPEVEAYNLYCIHKNLLNKHVNKVILFLEKGCQSPLFLKEKIESIEVEDRISYKQWIDFSQKIEGIKILANSDIYFDETIVNLNEVDWNNNLAILSRKDLKKDGQVVDSEVFYESGKKINPVCSQDAWAYKYNLKEFYSNYKLGYWHCESRFRTEAIAAGIDVKNLTNYVRIIHVDWRGEKEKSKKSSYSNSEINNIPLYKKFF